MAPRFVLFLLALLLSVATPAQPRKPAAVVDSPAECTTMSGSWKPHGSDWQRACQVPWAQDDCLHLGGAWTPPQRGQRSGTCFAPVSERAMARQCAEGGGTWGPPGSSMPVCRFDAPTAAAVRTAPDTNRLCDSQSDCTYGCVYQGPETATGKDVMGRCRATNQASGCYAMVEKGRLAGRVCVN